MKIDGSCLSGDASKLSTYVFLAMSSLPESPCTCYMLPILGVKPPVWAQLLERVYAEVHPPCRPQAAVARHPLPSAGTSCLGPADQLRPAMEAASRRPPPGRHPELEEGETSVMHIRSSHLDTHVLYCTVVRLPYRHALSRCRLLHRLT